MDSRPLLRLLLEEADAEALKEPLDAARRQGRPEDELARLHQDTLDALQLRTILDQRRRRERELAALFDTAWDLTQLRDVERALRAIVRRARSLLRSDTAYLTLIDAERNDIYMRVSDGTISPEFRKIRLPLGTGLGGLVAQGGTPYSTSNYLEDSRYKHTNSVDDVVEEEGLIAILGVPLKLGGDVIGVLFASDRSDRQFTANDVSLLSSFAAMAAIALENARLFQELETAVDELNRANEVIQAHSEAVERAADAHAKMTALVTQGTDLSELVISMNEVLDGSLVAVNTTGRVLAYGDQVLDGLDDAIHRQGTLPEIDAAAPLFEAIATAGERGQSVRLELGAHLVDRWVAPVFGGDERLGALILGAHREVSDIDLRTFERASHVAALLMLNRRSIVEARRRASSELLGDLIDRPDIDDDLLASRAQAANVDLSAPYCVMVASVPASHRQIALHAAGELCSQVGGICALHTGEVVILLPEADPDKTLDLGGDRIRRVVTAPVTMGAAGPATGGPEIRDAYDAAVHCLRSLVALGREGESATAQDLGMYGFLLADTKTDDIDQFLQRTLGGLLTYDDAHRTNLITTLAAYFDANSQASAAANRLHIHVNTLYQRLQRIGEVLGVDLDESETRLQLQLAVRLHQLHRQV